MTPMREGMATEVGVPQIGVEVVVGEGVGTLGTGPVMVWLQAIGIQAIKQVNVIRNIKRFMAASLGFMYFNL